MGLIYREDYWRGAQGPAQSVCSKGDVLSLVQKMPSATCLLGVAVGAAGSQPGQTTRPPRRDQARAAGSAQVPPPPPRGPMVGSEASAPRVFFPRVIFLTPGQCYIVPGDRWAGCAWGLRRGPEVGLASSMRQEVLLWRPPLSVAQDVAGGGSAASSPAAPESRVCPGFPTSRLWPEPQFTPP